MSYESLIFYSVVTSVITLDRVNLKKRVVDAPEILTVIDSIPNLTSFLNSLYMCQYGSFFKVSCHNLFTADWALLHQLNVFSHECQQLCSHQ